MLAFILYFFSIHAGLCQLPMVENFSWGAGVSNRTACEAGTSINGLLAESGGGTSRWVGSDTAVFGGVAGLGNGELLMSGSSSSIRIQIPAVGSDMVAATAEGKFTPGPGETRGFFMGFQKATATALLINQTTDKIHARVDPAGTVSLVSVVGGVTNISTGSITFASGNSVAMELLLQPATRLATLTVTGANQNNRTVCTQTWASATTNWQAFAVNATGSSTLELSKVACYKIPAMPQTFPIHMSFSAFGPTSPWNLNDSTNYAVHHSPSQMAAVRTNNPNAIIITGAGWAIGSSGTLVTNWPGYLMYYTGTKITNALDTTATTISVADTNCFRVSDPDVGPDHAIIYALNADNTPNWNYFEYCKVTNIVAGAIQVERHTSMSTARSFTNQQAVVAAHVSCWVVPETGEQQWIPNFSLHAPTNPATGLQGWQWNSERVAANFLTPDANGNIMNGIEHDVFSNNRNISTRPMDCDNNRTPDAGYMNGINSFNLGIAKYLRNLRYLIGPDKIIQFDSGSARNGYRGWKYVNGVQMESFMKGSPEQSALEHLDHMASDAQELPKFSYGLTKHLTNLGPVTDSEFRRNFGYALMLGMPSPFRAETTGVFVAHYVWDEQCGGTSSNFSWLGMANGAAVRDTSNLGADLIGGAAWTLYVDTASGYSAVTNGSLSTGLCINVTACSPTPALGTALYHDVDLRLGSVITQTVGEEYTLIFAAKGDDRWVVGGDVIEDMPRLIDVTYQGSVGVCSVLADKDWRTYYMTYAATTNFQPHFGFGETIGTNWIKNIQLKTGAADRWSRDFQNGKVFVNMSKTAWTNNLGTNIYWRLKGTTTSPVNNGEQVSGTLVVPAEDAVFLRKTNPN